MSDGQTAVDEDGLELPTLLAALVEAEQSARDLRDSWSDDLPKDEGVVQIVDETGHVFDVVPIFPDRALTKH